MIILKLGGSVLTKKDSNEAKVDYHRLNRIVDEIKNAFNVSKQNLLDGLVIIHGAGSFGHPPAKKYKIGESFKEEEYFQKKIGFSKIQNEVKKLNSIICEALIDNNIPCVSIPPSSIIETENKRIKTFDLDIIKRYLEEGFVPVIYGDVVLDTKLKIAVLSGDQILQYIAQNMLISDRLNREDISNAHSNNHLNNHLNNHSNNHTNEIILGTDVDGVFTKNPKKYENAELIPVLNSLNQIEEFDSTTNIDVTGGMIGKIRELLQLADLGIESKIINANEPKAIYNILKNKKFKGTIINKNNQNY